MLLIPAENAISKKNPPYLTILLIVVNVWVFYFLQSDSGKIYEKAIEFYQQSDLLSKEEDAFYDYLLRNDVEVHNELKRASSYLPDEQLISYIIQRQDFSQHIKNLSSYSLEWRNKRQELQHILEEDFTHNYVFKNYNPTVTDAFVSMFMHGSNSHLWGNMLFLFLFGFNLELLLGRGKTLFLYLASGFVADGLYLLTETSGYASALGASGAIAGLMGGFCGWYGLKNIRYFYWFAVIFDYIKLPAALIFIYYLAKEYISSIVSDENVAYMAHFGGLLGGFVCVLVFKYLIKPSTEPAVVASEPDADTINPLKAKYDEACSAFQSLNFERARYLFNQLIEKDPHNIDYYTKLYALEKVTPTTGRFDEFTNLVLLRSLNDPRFVKLADTALTELTSNGNGLKALPADTLIYYIRHLIKRGLPHQAKPLINFIVKHHGANQELPKLLFQFGLACEKDDDHITYKKVFTYLSQKHPETFVGEEAKKALSRP